jgi:hypothetical protein
MAYRKRQELPPITRWYDDNDLKFSTAPSRTLNADGTPALTRAELAERLLEIADNEDNGKPKTGRRYWYLALSHGYVRPDMSDSAIGKKSRADAQKRITAILGVLRKQGRLAWSMVLDLTRDLDQWQTFNSPREARADLREHYDEDRWFDQDYFPIFIVEKDTLEPVCRPMAMRWQMPFASSRGYGSLKLQYDVARMLRRRKAKTGQWAIVYFVSDHDPSGLDLQAAWEKALENFAAPVFDFVRIGLTAPQVQVLPPLLRQGIEVKPSDSRSTSYVSQHGNRCWEADVLSASAIEAALNNEIGGWLDREKWDHRKAEIEKARELL